MERAYTLGVYSSGVCCACRAPYSQIFPYVLVPPPPVMACGPEPLATIARVKRCGYPKAATADYLKPLKTGRTQTVDMPRNNGYSGPICSFLYLGDGVIPGDDKCWRSFSNAFLSNCSRAKGKTGML